MMDGVIFDFNGTLFLDSDKHEKAWCCYLQKLTGKQMNSEEIKKNIHGRVNEAILKAYTQRELSASEIAIMSSEKEMMYRSLCMEDQDCLKLISGAAGFLDFLQHENIPFTIATASGEENVDFYFEMLGLERWFQKSNIIFDDGTFPGKPEPDIYLKAANRLNIKPEKCVVFEDAASGIQAAYAAGIEQIIAVATTFSKEYLMTLEPVKCVIDNFEGTKDVYQGFLNCW